MIHKSINALPFYGKLKHQNRFKENVANGCFYKLYSPVDRFLKFQFLDTDKDLSISKIELVFSKYNRVDLTNNKSKLEILHKDVGTFVQYLGEPLIFKAQQGDIALVLDSVPQWLEITLSNGNVAYSEVFYPNEDLSHLTKIEYKSDKDLFPILYKNGFEQEIYLDTYIHANEPEIEEEVKENADKTLKPVSQVMITNYKINHVCPDYLKLALTSLQMHNEVEFNTPKNLTKIKASRVVVVSTLASSGELSNVGLSIREILLTLSACNTQII